MTLSAKFSERAANMQTAVIRQLLARASSPDIIPFTVGKPAEHLFPLEETYRQTGHIIEKYGGSALQYSSSVGLPELRQWLAERTDNASWETTQMIAGSQQGIDLCGKLFVDPGDFVAFAVPTYPSAISTLKVYGPRFLQVECDTEGVIPESAEAIFKHSPKLMYCIPNFANPTGVYMTLERRRALVALAQRYNVAIVEDDPYGRVQFEGEPLPFLYELAPEQVIYIGSFSKVLAPGFRLGWLMTAEPVFTKLMQAKQAADLQTSTYIQTLVLEMLRSGLLDKQIEKLTAYYRAQRDALIAAMERHFPEEAVFQAPSGGMFVWCELPEGVNTTALLEEALARKVVYMPGQRFFPLEDATNGLRLSYTMATPEQIDEGIQRLGLLFKQAIAAEAVV